MGSTFKVEYNIKGIGPRILTWGDKDLKIDFYNKINHKQLLHTWGFAIPNTFWQIPRQWFSNWVIEVKEWNQGKLQTIFTDIFNPYNKTVHFYLDENSSLEEHIEYSKACNEFFKKWSTNTIIESPFSDQLQLIFPNLIFTNKILNENDCYVNYEIKEKLSYKDLYEKYKIYMMNQEILCYGDSNPLPKDQLTPYEFAYSIIFGPNPENVQNYVPYEWIFKEPFIY